MIVIMKSAVQKYQDDSDDPFIASSLITHLVTSQLPVQLHHNHEHIRHQHGRQSQRAEELLSQHPLFLVLQSFEEEIPERIGRIRPGQALIEFLVILVRSEPELVRVQEEHQAEQQEDKHEAEGDFRHCEEA